MEGYFSSEEDDRSGFVAFLKGIRGISGPRQTDQNVMEINVHLPSYLESPASQPVSDHAEPFLSLQGLYSSVGHSSPLKPFLDTNSSL